MIDNGSKSWTLFTYRPDTASNRTWVVVGTRWTKAGPTKDERILGGYETEQAAREACVTMQREYDRMRNLLYVNAKEANK